MKTKTRFQCDGCGAESPQWAGRCTACGEWNSLHELADRPVPGRVPIVAVEPAMPIVEVDAVGARPAATGLAEVDRVLGGGLVAGSVTLVGGEPGVGKSTLLAQLAAWVASAGRRVLYVSAEESREQVRSRAERLGAAVSGVWLATGFDLDAVVAHIDDVRPHVVIVDSIQTVSDPQVASAPGTVTQVRECAHRLVTEARTRGVAVLLVGHVTKEGNLAGPRVLEHVVDTVLAFEGDRHHALRLLRAVKHRFGSTDELGVFEMGECGLTAVPDASALFLADRRPGVAGSAVAATVEGHRPLLVEVQALAMGTTFSQPRYTAQGVDGGRLAFLLAVLAKHADVKLEKTDVFAVAAGGVRVIEPGADLALALAVASSVDDVPLPPDLVACAEVGLGGELRQVSSTPRRLAEAARFGFRRAIVPPSAVGDDHGLTVQRAGTVAEAIALAGLDKATHRVTSVRVESPAMPARAVAARDDTQA